MMNRMKLTLYCFCLMILSTLKTTAEGTFEDAELVNEFITMSFSSSHPYDLRHTIPGEPDIDYPIYSAVPKTNFDCTGRHEGYYADIETRCQVFRICTNTDLIGRGFAFLCPNGTLFSQKNFVCDWYRNVDCSDSERYYSKNNGNRIGTKTQIMETVRQMMEHPMKTISIALNRGKPITPNPIRYNNFGISTMKTPTIFHTTPASIRSFSTQQLNGKRQPETRNQIVNSAKQLDQHQGKQLNAGFESIDSSPVERVKSSQPSLTTLVPPLRTFSPPTETGLPVTFESPLPSQQASLEAFPFVTSAPLSTTESSGDEKEVYVSNLGELSTDPGANFDPQTARIIAEPLSSSIDLHITSESGSLTKKLNFAGKVNAGLNGQRVVSQNEIIAPEYVQNIMRQSEAVPEKNNQIPSYEFASNINSLLDEVAYDTELEGQNSVQVQQRAQSNGFYGSTRKPFRFLSRGFSYDNTRQGGSYVYRPPTPGRNSLPTIQLSTSTQSYSSSFLTTPLFTNPVPVTLSETANNFVKNVSSDEIAIEPIFNLNSIQENIAYLNGRTQNQLIQKNDLIKAEIGSKMNVSDVSQRFGVTAKLNGEPELETKPITKEQQKDEKKESTANTLNALPQDLNDGDKANANKRAEKLLIAGVMQTILDTLSEKSNSDDLETTSPILPIYIRLTESGASSLPTTSDNISTTPSFTSTARPTTSSTTTSSTSPITRTTSESPITTTQSTRKYTVNNAHRKQTSRPVVVRKRQNVVRSALRTTTYSTVATISPVKLKDKFGSSIKPTSTSTTSTAGSITTTKPTLSNRRRASASRFSFGSRRRSIASTSSNSTTTTTEASKKLAIRSSDKDLSDLTAVASTYNVAPKRDYNSIRQNSYKYIETQHRRPNHKTKGSDTNTRTSTTTTTSTTTQPRRSSSLPTPTLAPFSHEALSFISSTSKTPAPSPASFLSFNDLTKAIIDDSILQTFRRNQEFTGSTLKPLTLKSQSQIPIIQPFGAPVSTPRSRERSTQRTTVQPVTRTPYVPLKEFIASKFGAHYSPAPPSLSSLRPTQPTVLPINELSIKIQKQPNYAAPMQQPVVHQNYVPRTVVSRKSAPALPQTIHQFAQQNPVQQPQYITQQKQVHKQHQYHQLRQQVAPVLQSIEYQHQLNPTVQPILYRSAATVQAVQPAHQIPFRFTALQQIGQKVPNHQQSEKATIQQGQQILQRTIPPVQQQQKLFQVQQFARNQPGQSIQQSQIQIFPSHMAASQTIPPNSNLQSDVASVNIRLPTNVAGLIPNTDFYDTRLSSDSLSRAQKRVDLPSEESDSMHDSKSVYSGVTSYDVPINSVGRLANDITHLLRRLRRL